MHKKVLFISQYAGRTGAPLMLLNLLGWLKNNTALPFEVLLLADGPLHLEFSKLAPVHLFPEETKELSSRFDRLIKRLGQSNSNANAQNQLLDQLRNNGVALLYANTVVNGKALEALAPLGCPAITHIHELDYWIEQSGKKNFEQVKKRSHRFIAASKAVKNNLVGKYAIPSEKIEVVHSFIPTNGISANPKGLREELGIPNEAFIVLGSGHETWRKGKDLFVQLAALMVRNYSHIKPHFLWVGGWQKEEDRRNILHDVQHLGLTNCVHFSGEVNNPLDYFAAGNVFAMVSREDPFPLVCLEAALLGKPLLCFADAGGMPEFVEDDAGFVVPYLDINRMAEKIALLAGDSNQLIRLGSAAQSKVKSRYDVERGSKQIFSIIEEVSNI